MSIDLTGTGVLVTGGTSGLGAETVRSLAGLGAEVVVAGRSVEAGAELAAAVGDRARFVKTDVTDAEAVAHAVDAASSAPRGLRVAVSAAGAAVVRKTLDREGRAHPLPDFEQMLNVNLIGAFNVLRLAAESMAKNELDADGSRGVVILTSSIGAFEGQAGQVAYAAAKGGIVSMVLPAARDLARSGIRVLGIAPGVFDTPFMDVLSDEARASIAGSVPFPARLGRASEFSDLVTHVVANPMLNGTVIRLDGALRLGAR